MPKALRHTLISTRDVLMSVGPFLVLAVLLLALAYWWMKPTPPKHVTLATGPAQSAYAEFGTRYADWLQPYGITVTLRTTEGSTENLELLRKGEVDLGFVQGGTSDARPEDEDALESLGSLFVEPVWVFYRMDTVKKVQGLSTPVAARSPQSQSAQASQKLTSIAQLKGLRVNWDTPGSGVPNLMRKLLESNRIAESELTLSELDDTPAAVALLQGDLDAIVLAQAPESLIVQMLLMTPGIELMDLVQNEAYSRRLAFLAPVTLSRGVVDLAKDWPRDNVHLVAPTTSLIANDDTHPALLHLFSMAAHSLHGGAGWFNKAFEYPNAKRDELPLAKEADRYIKNGPPFLQRHMPFWAANLIDRMWVAMGVILAILLPLSRVLPPLYKFRIRSRIFRWYEQLRDIEQNPTGQHEALDRLDKKVERISVPLSYVDELYALRQNIAMVRRNYPNKPETVRINAVRAPWIPAFAGMKTGW